MVGSGKARQLAAAQSSGREDQVLHGQNGEHASQTFQVNEPADLFARLGDFAEGRGHIWAILILRGADALRRSSGEA